MITKTIEVIKEVQKNIFIKKDDEVVVSGGGILIYKGTVDEMVIFKAKCNDKVYIMYIEYNEVFNDNGNITDSITTPNSKKPIIVINNKLCIYTIVEEIVDRVEVAIEVGDTIYQDDEYNYVEFKVIGINGNCYALQNCDANELTIIDVTDQNEQNYYFCD